MASADSAGGATTKIPVMENEAGASFIEDMGIVDGLCEICRHTLRDWDKLIAGSHPPHHNSLLELRRSAKKGCALCALFMSDVICSGHVADTEVESLDMRDIESENSNHSVRGLYSRVCPSHMWLAPGSMQWTLFMNRGRNFSSIVFSPVLHPVYYNYKKPYSSPSHDELTLLASEWLRNCNDHHDNCLHASHDCKLPTRLLRIDRQNCQLTHSVNLPCNTKYATLSHCWGTGQNLKLTKSNLHAFENTIPWNELCKTFQDAIFIASKLDIDYLWIDSLCIIQDDGEDWRKESVLMSQVYGNSYLNIAAAGASDGSQGCFFEDNRMRVNRLQVETIENGKGKLFDCIPEGIYDYCVSNTPLSSRAWTLQERLLAPRTLHFSRAQILWECNRGISCESLPYQVWVPATIMDSDHYLKKSDLSASWKKLISVYSKCQLTKIEDKLVALSGIIRKIQDQRHDECFAGLWKRKIETELLWKLTQPSLRPAVYVAPSWSWASLNGTVQADRFHVPNTAELDERKELYIHVMDVYVNPCGDDPLGELRGGSISLLCRTLIFVTSLDPDHPHPDGRYGTRIKARIKGKDEYVELDLSVFWDCEESLEEAYLLPFYYVLLIRGLIFGLVIVPTGQEQGQYRRVGLFRSPRDYQRGGAQELAPILMNPEHCAGTDAFAGFLDDSRYEKEHWILNIV
ncbi:hypothetical protein LOCC1_G004620 [Lachnellula occidentalis]|uniref:Heterokaryon incompatibility domain-containing protein n=1 Tax=Lachnellula occidentalis TaxID=215460 RepID=A0A8H8S154_9HELO|nr:hypothetical protein LOCC1_G004620 [Lachnellula occidentalis]